MSNQQSTSNSPWYTKTTSRTLEALGVKSEQGLTAEEGQQRLAQYGPNSLQEAETRPWWKILFNQFKSIVVQLLVVAAILAFISQKWAEGIAVVAVLLINAIIGFASEWKAVRSMAALRKISRYTIRARRNGTTAAIDVSELVPGDIVLLAAGELVPADMRLIQAENLRVNEASLTGESIPASKLNDVLTEDTELADRQNMVYKGTGVVDGHGEGVVVATGGSTELGKISRLAQEAEGTVTPIQKRLDQLGRRLAWTAVGIAVAIAVIGFFIRHQEASLVIETALALGIAAIPEGLPIVATISLARGMFMMAQRNALVNQLTAVETLGAARVIFSDKTGTLTENRMDLQKIASVKGTTSLSDVDGSIDDPLVSRMLELGVLCNSASLAEDSENDTAQGDPTEIALLEAGRRFEFKRSQLVEKRPQVRVEKFDSRTKKMATFHQDESGILVAVKGAPESVLEVSRCLANDNSDQILTDEMRQEWLNKANEMASEGLRLLAIATKRVSSKDENPYADLNFLGLVGLMDPPRKAVKGAIDACQSAGMRVEMVTGDQPETAKAIAKAVGIVGDANDPTASVMRGHELKNPDELDEQAIKAIYQANIFSRVSPEQKLNLVKIYQDQGEVVAMTGDGVNDAPALKKADIGIAMGQRGTEAAKQVADMILKDDAFETIVAAVEQGRVIFNNIRKSTMFMLCTNVAEVLAVAVAAFVGWTLPLLPLQILYLNVLTDVFPAMALGVGPRSGNEMEQPPRDPQESVLTRSHWLEVGGWAGLVGACVLISLLLAQHWLGLENRHAVTISFLTLGFSKLWFTFNLRAPRSGLIHNEITRNPWVWAAIGLCLVLLLAAVYLPGLSGLLQTRRLTTQGWFLVLGMSVIPFVVGQVLRTFQKG
jgi:Ca2+-transporting ATPase